MNFIFVRDNCVDGGGTSLLRFALDGDPLAGIVLGALRNGLHQNQKNMMHRSNTIWNSNRITYVIPESWEIDSQRFGSDGKIEFVRYKGDVPLASVLSHSTRISKKADPWYSISNGRFVTNIDATLLEKAIISAGADLVAINAEPTLLGGGERLRLTSEGNVAGFRRVYSDTAEFTFIPEDWPHHLFIRADVFDKVLEDGSLPLSFSEVSRKCRSANLKMRALDLGGTVLDLETVDGILDVCGSILSHGDKTRPNAGHSCSISSDAKLVGNVILGDNVDIGPEAVIIGPSIVGNNVRIERGAVISSSIIGPKVCIRESQLIRNRIVKEHEYDHERSFQRRRITSYQVHHPTERQTSQGTFRNWPIFSYARCLKRIADFVAAIIVLILFAPVMPFIALAIKLNSPGPVFYSDKRQGLHGKKFGCLKFRTMVTGAATMQDKLRFVSQVDGPQFKMNDDPRISSVGRFLRETYIDEIPQFFNVLFGQMSIVGPRPSPESENTLCPSWRDARLSVRPGITGLWQLHRTREPMRDFQEWIHYDTMYVRNLSLKMDLLTCWQTAMKLLDNFISQF